MTHELFSTSVPAGLEPGRSGFCTVAMTRGLSRPLVEALEALSAYRPVFLPTDPRADDNPVAVSYLRVPAAGRYYHVVSRIGFAGADYTGRSNRFAHHVVLDANDPRPPGGPAWLASRPGFLEAAFDGEVRHLAAGRAVPAGAPASAACPTWQRLTGDAGWAGVVAEALANPAARSFFLVYDLGADVLALLREAVGLLPPERRWEATFTTYFTGLPAGVGCTVRGVLRGSPEAGAVLGSSLDLGKLAGKKPPVNEWTAAARAGRAVASRQVAVNAPVKAGSPPSPAQLATPQPLPFADIHAPGEFGFDDAPRLEREPEPGGVGKWVVLTVLASLVFLGGGAGAVVMMRPDLFRRAHHAAEAGDEKDKAATAEEEDKAGNGDRAKTPGKFAPSRAALSMDRPVAGSPSLLRVDLAFPKNAPAFPAEKLRFTLDGKELAAKPQGGGGFLVTLPSPGPHRIVAEYAGDDRLGKVSIPLDVKALAPMPKFTVEAPPKARRGEAVEVGVKGLPAGFTGFGKIELIGPAGKLKVEPIPGGKKWAVVGGLNPGRNAIRAAFPGDETFAEGTSEAAEVRVQRKPVLAFEPLSRDDFSRGKIGLTVTVRGSEKGDPIPKGTLQFLSKDEKLVEGGTGDKGKVALSKGELAPGLYELKLRFTPDDKDDWAAHEEPLNGTWRVVPSARLVLELSEKDSKDARETFHFASPTGAAPVANLPPDKRFFLRFRPGKQEMKGALESHFELEKGRWTLALKWRPGKDSWGMAKPLNTPAFPVIALSVPDTEKAKGKPFPEDAVKYTLPPAFPPPQSRDVEAYRPLVPAFRGVVDSLHGAEIELYEGFDVRFRARAKAEPKRMRVRAAWVSADLAGNLFGNNSQALNSAVIAACASHLAPPERGPLPLMRLRLNRK